MRRLVGTLIALLALALPATAAAEARPLDGGGMVFAPITGPGDPEDYSYEVTLGEDQVLRPVDEHEAAVFYSGHLPAFTITAPPASAADGAAVPTTLAVTGPDEVTLTVHHRAGNPAAGFAPFAYPITAGPGWEGGFRTITVEMLPPGEVERRQREIEAASPPATIEPPQPTRTVKKPRRVFVVNALGSDKLVHEPRAFLLSADGSFGVQALEWGTYGGAVARATGRGYLNDCDPNCAAGEITHPPAKLTLSKVVDCDGTPIYARLRYALSGPLPDGFPRRGGYSTRPVGDDGKPDC